MLKKSASREKAEVQAKVEDKIQNIRSSLNLDLDLSPSLVLRPCLGQGASQGEESVLADSGREGEITAGVGRVRSLAFLSILERWTAPCLGGSKADGERADVEGLPASLGQGFEDEPQFTVCPWSIASRMRSVKMTAHEARPRRSCLLNV